MNLESPNSPQPLLPRISMRWYFVLVMVVAFLIALVVRTNNPQAWAITLILTLGFLLLFFMVSAICFLVAFSFGAVAKIAFSEEAKTESPFANETMPPQVIPPHAARD